MTAPTIPLEPNLEPKVVLEGPVELSSESDGVILSDGFPSNPNELGATLTNDLVTDSPYMVKRHSAASLGSNAN